MLIRRIAVRNFRKHLAGVVVADLEPGLTVIAGDNEEGKSTLLKALQAALFDRHNLSGRATEDMLPFGSKVRPEIDVDFEIDGTRYRLVKGFHQSPSARLESEGRHWQDDGAEERLRELLGFSPPGRGAAKEEHRGLSGLLWVEQGRAFAPLGLNRDTRDALHEAIAGEVGQVTGGERGRNLLAAVQRACDEYYTPTGREKSTLKKVRSEAEAAGGECERLERELSQYDAQVDRLERLRRTLAHYESTGELANAQDDLEKAQMAAKELEELEGRIATAKAELKTAESALELARSKLKHRRDDAKRLEAVEAEARKAERGFAGLDEALRAADIAYEQADGSLKSARSAFASARSKRLAAGRERERAEIAVALKDLEDKLERAREIDAGIARNREAVARIRIGEEDLEALRKNERTLDRQRAALEAVATTLDFSPDGNRSVRVDGKEIAIDGPYRVTERTSFELEGFGRLDVTPGGKDVRTRRAKVEERQHSLDADLARWQYRSVGEAEVAFRQKSDTLKEVESAGTLLAGIAPAGLEALRNAVAARREELAARTSDPALPPASIEEARRAEDATASEEAEAEAAQSAAEGEWRARQKASSEAREKWTESKSARRHHDQERERLREELDHDRRIRSDADLEHAEDAALRGRDGQGGALQSLEERREAMSPDLVRGELGRAREARSGLKDQIDRDKGQARDLEIELRTLGRQGLGEQVEQQRRKREAARQELERRELDAKAWKLLRDTLQEAERKARETFLAPVRERLQPYLKLLFPSTDLLLDEDGLEIKSLRRGEAEEPFTSLSIGAREQIAVLARLALADLLREKGKPVALILDDALVNCDDDRFRRMGTALRRAAEHVQILILTCHEARYRMLGAKTVRLIDCGEARH